MSSSRRKKKKKKSHTKDKSYVQNDKTHGTIVKTQSYTVPHYILQTQIPAIYDSGFVSFCLPTPTVPYASKNPIKGVSP